MCWPLDGFTLTRKSCISLFTISTCTAGAFQRLGLQIIASYSSALNKTALQCILPCIGVCEITNEVSVGSPGSTTIHIFGRWADTPPAAARVETNPHISGSWEAGNTCNCWDRGYFVGNVSITESLGIGLECNLSAQGDPVFQFFYWTLQNYAHLGEAFEKKTNPNVSQVVFQTK